MGKIGPVGAVPPVRGVSAVPSASVASDAAAVASVSDFGLFLTKLQALELSNPEKAKQILRDVANRLQAQGGSSTSPGDAARLARLAERFQKAAQGGGVSSLSSTTRHDRRQAVQHYRYLQETTGETVGVTTAQALSDADDS